MADAVVIKEFLATLGYRVDESAQRKFMDAITSMSNAVIGLGAGITGAASAVVAAVANMAGSASQMQYFSQTLGETVNNVDAIIYAWQRLGVAPQQTMSALQNLANMIRTEPGMAGLWNEKAGPGSLTQQFERMGERFAQMTAGDQRIFRQQFEKYLGTDVINAWMTRGGQAGEGVGEFNMVRRMFRFDPDDFAKQSVQFERAWQSFQLRLNDLAGHAAGPILDRMTSALRGMTAWLDAHADEIIADIDKIGKRIKDDFTAAVDLVRSLSEWFNRLSPAGKEVAEAIGLIALAFAKPGWVQMGIIALGIEKLVQDFEHFKQTGQSEFGIPWEGIIQKVGQLVNELQKLSDATNGWITPLHIVETYMVSRFAVSIIGVFTGIRVAAVATGEAVSASLLGSIGGAIGKLLPMLGPLLGIYMGLNVGKNQIGTDAQENAIMGGGPQNRPGFRPAPPGAKEGPVNPERVLPKDDGQGWLGSLWHSLIPSAGAAELPNAKGAPQVLQAPDRAAPRDDDSSVWGKLGHFLSYLNPISAAKADELPDNVKDLSQQIVALNAQLGSMADNQSLFGGWAGGLGAGIVGNLFGGGASGGQDAVKNINDPKAVEAVKYLMSKGWSLPQALGMVGNLMEESGLSTTIVNSTGHAGVAQWDRQRQATFQSLTGKPVTSASMNEQLDFVDWELKHSEAKAGFALGQAGNEREAAFLFDRLYERSEGQDINKRLAYASALGSNPNIQNSTYSGGDVHQTNNVVINTTADPDAIGKAWDEYNRRHWADVQRNQQGAFQ